MKRLSSAAALFSALSLLTAFITVPAHAVDVSAHAAVLIESSSGEIIFEKNAHEKLPMASTTKIMTAVVALENAKPDQIVKVSPQACGVEGSSIYLVPGEELTMEQLLYALMLESANDAAAAIAIAVSGSVDAFADQMNETAARIGLTDSHFTNPHGLDNEQHYTTAADLAKLTAYAMQNQAFRKIAATRKYTIPAADGTGTRVLINHNRLLQMSDDVIGVKTGFTKRSGRCLVSAAERDGVSVIAVTLNAPDDWQDHTNLHELGFSSYETVTLAEPGEFQIEVPCPGASDGTVTLVNREPLSRCLKNGTEFRAVVECGHMIYPPVTEGESCGQVTFVSDDKVLGSVLLYAAENIAEPEDNRSIGEKILDSFR